MDDKLGGMFSHTTKQHRMVGSELISSYKRLLFQIKSKQENGTISFHKENNYLGGNELANDIYKRKYYLKDLDGNPIESRPEQTFARIASYLAAVENTDNQGKYAERFYEILYNGFFLPGGRVIAGAGDLFRLKTLANCFVTLIKKDNIESIYNAAYDCARTYSYGGGIGIDISSLRPKDSVVHNAADKSTGAVSFMEIYSLTTGLIGQSGRRGALMITLDVKHPDVLDFINVKKTPNWITNQIVEQCKWSNKFNEDQLSEIHRQVRENTQVRFANISLKVSDEFMKAVEETRTHKRGALLLYKKLNKEKIMSLYQSEENHYGNKIPSRDISQYEYIEAFDTLEGLNRYLSQHNLSVAEHEMKDESKRDLFGDYVLDAGEHDFAVRYTGEYMLYFGSENTGDIKHLANAEEIWSAFVSGNYSTAEPGLIFWDTMTKYSPSDYLGRKISSTNPCGEIPLEDGGACNLGSLNLSRFVKDGYTENAEVDWDKFIGVATDVVRLLDNVIAWNAMLNPLEKQRKAALDTRRIGVGIMGIADMLNQLGMEYDSGEGIKLIEKITKILTETCYKASAKLAAEKGPLPIWDYEKYSEGHFFKKRLNPDIQELIKNHGLRNIALTSIAPTGTISNVVLGYKTNGKHYIGVSGGIEPIFSLFYTRRTESMGNRFFKIFHSTVQAYIDQHELNDKVQDIKEMDGLRKILPDHFFRTSHFIEPEQRVLVQGACQKFIDHSISSTVNLPESVDPETISTVYLDAWANGLKGITIYRDGSRYPILSVEREISEFQKIKEKEYILKVNGGGEKTLKGDEVFKMPDGRLSTPFHAMKAGYPVREKVSSDSKNVSTDRENDDNSEGKTCKIKFEGGKLIKTCSE